MRLLPHLLLAATLLAGCVTTPPQGSATADPPANGSAPDAPENATRHIEQAFDLTVRSGPANAPGAPPNCVFVKVPEGARILGGRATATWTAATPLAQSLELLAGAGTGSAMARKSSGSPLEVEVPAMGSDDHPYVAVQVPADDAGAAVDQAVRLQVALDVEGPVEFNGLGACGD